MPSETDGRVADSSEPISTEWTFLGWRVADQQWHSPEEFLTDVARADLVCLEQPESDAVTRAATVTLIAQLVARARMSGRELRLGLPQVLRGFQPDLDRWHNGRMALPDLLDRLQPDSESSRDRDALMPWLLLAERRRLAVLALGRDPPLDTHSKTRPGASEDPADAVTLGVPAAPIDMSEATDESTLPKRGQQPHRARRRHQEFMARILAERLAEGLPAAQILVLAEPRSCDRSALPERIVQRLPSRVLGVRPWVGNADSPPELGTASPDWVMVLSPAATQPR